MQAAVDWNGVIERNREALRRILASLVAMAALAGVTPTLPRHLHRAVAKLLRPAEAAARRLIIMAARGIVVQPPRPRKAKPMTVEPIMRRLGIAVVVSAAELARIVAARRAAAIRAVRPRTLSLPLFDPLRTPRRWRPIQRSQPRISSLELGSVRTALRPPSTPYDPVSGARLVLRFAALDRVLDDLPGHALRFARLRASRKAAAARDNDSRTCRSGRRRFHRSAPLKPGRPPGWRKKPTHEVHEVLKDLHHFAFYELEKPDTS